MKYFIDNLLKADLKEFKDNSFYIYDLLLIL